MCFIHLLSVLFKKKEVHACQSSTWEEEARESGAQDHPWLLSMLEGQPELHEKAATMKIANKVHGTPSEEAQAWQSCSKMFFVLLLCVINERAQVWSWVCNEIAFHHV